MLSVSMGQAKTGYITRSSSRAGYTSVEPPSSVAVNSLPDEAM